MSPPPMLPQQRSLQLSAADCQLAAEQPALDAPAHDSDDDGSQVALLGGTACRSDDTHPGDFGSGSSSDIAAAQAARLHSTSTAGGQQSGAESLLQVHIMRPAALASALAALQQSSSTSATFCSRRADSPAHTVGIAAGLRELAASGRLPRSRPKSAIVGSASANAAASSTGEAAAASRAAALSARLPPANTLAAEAHAAELLAALSKIYRSMAGTGHLHAVLTRCHPLQQHTHAFCTAGGWRSHHLCTRRAASSKQHVVACQHLCAYL